MRAALLVAPSRASFDRTAQIRENLVRAGFAQTVSVITSSGLKRDLEETLTGYTNSDALLVYVAGSTRLSDEGAIALVLGDGKDPPLLPLDAIGQMVAARPKGQTLLVLDAWHDGIADDVMRAAEHVDAAIRAVGARSAGFEVLVAAHAEEPNEEEGRGWPFTRLLADAIDEVDGDAAAAEVYERLREMPELAARVPAFAHVPGSGEFRLVARPRKAEQTPSVPVPAPSIPAPPTTLRPTQYSLRPAVMPQVAPILALAEAAREKGEWDNATAEYKKALMVVDPDDLSTKASIYAYLGEVKRAQGKPREAELNFEKALAAVPGHRRALDALVELAVVDKDWERVVAYRRKMVLALEHPAKKAAELGRIAMVLDHELSDPKHAAVVMEEARELVPKEPLVLVRLRGLYERARQWARLVETIGALHGLTSEAGERGRLRFSQADILLGRLCDEARGLEMLDAALADDPTHDEALRALVAVRTRRGEWLPLAHDYEKLIERFGALKDRERAWEACKRLAALRRDQLGDRDGAIEAFEGALRCKPRDADSRAQRADLLLARGEVEHAARELEIASVHAPTRVATYRRLYELHTRAGRTDRAWLVAVALEELGAAEIDHDLVIHQFREKTMPRPNAMVDDDTWKALVRASGADPAVEAILRAILPVAITMRLEELRDKKKLIELDPHKKQSETSTVSIVRAFQWASQVLGIALPDLYVFDDVPGGLAAVPYHAPSTAVGPTVLRDRRTPELAFVAGRHLTYYRPEHYALVFFPTLRELSNLVLSAVKTSMPAVPVSREVASLSRVLGKRLGERRAVLDAAVKQLDSRGGRLDLAAWVRGVELTAQRAGLLLAGDLKVVMTELRREKRAIAELSLDDKRADILSFSVSTAYAALRARLSMTAGASSRPPTV
jgi:tetratricopeptide (TPR) repeat protein